MRRAATRGSLRRYARAVTRALTRPRPSRRRRIVPPPRRAALALPALVLACAPAAATTAAANTQPTLARSAKASAPLVYMRRLQRVDQIFQVITVGNDGSGDTGTFIGEIAGVKHRPFRLPAKRLERLRALVARMRPVPTSPVVGGPPANYLYTVRGHGITVQVLQGRVPRWLRPLIGQLNGIINRYW
jgi:hypothetical protein